jgi:hypothetical protein
MDDLSFLRERVESYADYTNDRDSQLSDEQIRAYVGVTLAGIFERLEPSGPGAEALARVLLRCQFADLVVARSLESNVATASDLAAFHAADRHLISLAGQADAIDAAGLAAYCAQIDAALDERAAVITGAGQKVPPAVGR